MANSICWLAGNGDGTFRFPVFLGAATEPCGVATGPYGGLYPCSSTLTAAAIADFNGDGLPDAAYGLLVRGISSTVVAFVSIFLNDSPGDGFTAAGVSADRLAWPAGAGSIVTAFRIDLAPFTETATVNPAPTTLGGIRLHIRDRGDSAETLAPLLYVSPSQINYILPSSAPAQGRKLRCAGYSKMMTGVNLPSS